MLSTIYGLLESNTSFVYDATGTGVYTVSFIISIISSIVISILFYKLFDSFKYAKIGFWFIGVVISVILVFIFTYCISEKNMNDAGYSYPLSHYAVIGITSVFISLVVYVLTSLIMKKLSTSLKNIPF